ncbi:MAG: hypothetical protein AAGI52_13730 [Bacteroidota bacterium]
MSDPTAGIQAAINEVGTWERDADGYRGVVQLGPGLYRLREPVEISHSGVILRGAGASRDTLTGTTLFAEKRMMRLSPVPQAALTVGRRNGERSYGWVSWSQSVEGPRVEIITPFVTVGDRQVEVANPGQFEVGDAVVVERRCTDRWLEAIDRGGVDIRREAAPNTFWRCEADGARQLDAVFFRRVEAIRGRMLVLDAPLYDHIDRALAPATVQRVSDAYLDYADTQPNGMVRNVGVENLRVTHEVDTSQTERLDAYGGWAFMTDEDHIPGAIIFRMVEDAWARDLILTRWRDYGVGSRVATRVTVERVLAAEPVAKIRGGVRYGFSVGGWSQLFLLQDVSAYRCRHSFTVNGGITSSGIAFVRPTAYLAVNDDGSHRAWSSGILFDNLRHVQPWSPVPLGMYSAAHWGSDRGSGEYSPGHGWTGVHQVAWNVSLGEEPVFGKYLHLRVGDPPLAQNYIIGYEDARNGVRPPVTSGHGGNARPNGVGYTEQGEGRLYPVSLYDAQRDARRRR